MNHKWMHLLKWAGKILAVVSLLFIAKSLWEMEWGWIHGYPPWKLCFNLFLLSWFGVAGNYINAYVWKLYIDFFSQKRNDTRPIQKVYLKSNIAKYLPGNILQYADRNILGSQLGIGHKSIAAASVMELAVIVASAVLFAVAVSFREAAEALRYFSSYIIEKKLLFYCIGVMVILAGAFLYALYRFRLFNRLKPYWNLGLLKVTAKAIAFYMLVHVISGCFLSGIFLLFLHQRISFITVASANVIAWLLGYITVGSPGGIGIREAALVFLLRNVYPKEAVVTAAVILRLCCVLADFISYVSVWGIRKSKGTGMFKR